MRLRGHWEVITRKEFWDDVNELEPLLRLGFSNGPGAFMHSEPWSERTCGVTGKQDYTYHVNAVMRAAREDDPDDDYRWSRFYRRKEPMTVHEFVRACELIMPGVGICSMEWGNWLLDDQGKLRGDLKFPIYYESGRRQRDYYETDQKEAH
jgi:hypothetical protein